MSSQDAKLYLSEREVPRLFECLMTGLMFHRPSDHIQYLIECLEKVKQSGQEKLRWNIFVEMQQSKVPLPPISPSNGHRPISRELPSSPKESSESTKFKKDDQPRTPVHATSPLPPIKDKIIPDVPIIFLMGGPGSGKSTQANLLIQKYPGWQTISMGELLQAQASNESSGNAKWKMVNDLMSKGEMAPEDVVGTLLVQAIKDHSQAKGIIIQGYPRDLEQAKEYDRLVGRVDAVFLLDCEEETLSKQLLKRASSNRCIDNNVNTVAKRIQSFKEKTLPALKHYDDKGKLFIVEGENDMEEIAQDLAVLFEKVTGLKAMTKPHQQKKTPQGGRSSPPAAPSAPPPEVDVQGLPAHLLPPEIKIKDEGRRAGLPKAPVIFFAGGPGSGKGTQCKKVTKHYPGAMYISVGEILRDQIARHGNVDEKWSMISDLLRKGDLAPEEETVDLLIEAMQAQPEAHFYLIEGFPRNLQQLEDFNAKIGGMAFTFLLDCEEYVLHQRLSLRGKESERIDDNLVAIGKKLTFFKNNTMPILKAIDDQGKLVWINGDRDSEEIFFDISRSLDFAIYSKLPSHGEAKEEKEPVEEEIIEVTLVPEGAQTTGDYIANPSYTAEMDALASAQGMLEKSDEPSEISGQEALEKPQEATESESAVLEPDEKPVGSPVVSADEAVAKLDDAPEVPAQETLEKPQEKTKILQEASKIPDEATQIQDEANKVLTEKAKGQEESKTTLEMLVENEDSQSPGQEATGLSVPPGNAFPTASQNDEAVDTVQMITRDEKTEDGECISTTTAVAEETIQDKQSAIEEATDEPGDYSGLMADATGEENTE